MADMTADRLRFVLCIAILLGGVALMASLDSGVSQAVAAILCVGVVALLGFRGTSLTRKQRTES